MLRKLMNRRSFSVLAVAFVAVICADSLEAKGKVPEIRVSGVISSINLDTNTVVVRKSSRSSVTLLIQPATKIERNNVEVSLAAFKVGDRAQARIAKTTGEVTKFEAVGR